MTISFHLLFCYSFCCVSYTFIAMEMKFRASRICRQLIWSVCQLLWKFVLFYCHCFLTVRHRVCPLPLMLHDEFRISYSPLVRGRACSPVARGRVCTVGLIAPMNVSVPFVHSVSNEFPRQRIQIEAITSTGTRISAEFLKENTQHSMFICVSLCVLQ
jgi:hypothetical protein